MTPRRTGPAASAGPEGPLAWPCQITVSIVSPDTTARGHLFNALSVDGSPARVVQHVARFADLYARDEEVGEFLVLDTRMAEADAPLHDQLLLARRIQPEAWPRLWVDFRSATKPRATRAGAPAGPPARTSTDDISRFAPDDDLVWDEALRGVPLRADLRDPTWTARLRTRVALLPADVRSERLFEDVTMSVRGTPPQHAAGKPGCPTCRIPPAASSIQRGTLEADALLRLLLRPERYPNGVGHAVLDPDEAARAGAARAAGEAGPKAALTGDGHHTDPQDSPPPLDAVQANKAADRARAARQRQAARRRALYRACERAGLVAPLDAVHVALLLRVSALAAAFELGVEHAAGVLGFSHIAGEGRPSRSTLWRLVTELVGDGPSVLKELRWVDVNESARLALVAPLGFVPGVDAPFEYAFRPWTYDDDFDPAMGWHHNTERFRPLRASDFPDRPDMDGPGPVLHQRSPVEAAVQFITDQEEASLAAERFAHAYEAYAAAGKAGTPDTSDGPTTDGVVPPMSAAFSPETLPDDGDAVRGQEAPLHTPTQAGDAAYLAEYAAAPEGLEPEGLEAAFRMALEAGAGTAPEGDVWGAGYFVRDGRCFWCGHPAPPPAPPADHRRRPRRPRAASQPTSDPPADPPTEARADAPSGTPRRSGSRSTSPRRGSPPTA